MHRVTSLYRSQTVRQPNGWQRLFCRCQPSLAAAPGSASFEYRESLMANSSETDSAVRSGPRRGWSDAWHLWRIIMPRRSISDRLVWGLVWRRNRGGRWVYKKFVEY